MQEANPRLRAAILEIVENQLRDNDPPEARETYDRLIAEGHSDEDARRLIACALVSEISDVLKNREAYNHQRYVRALSRLPKMPWDE